MDHRRARGEKDENYFTRSRTNILNLVLGGMNEDFSMKNAPCDDSPRLPGRIPVETASKLLGFNKDEIAILMAKGHLKPLGAPRQNSPKWFATRTILEHAQDPRWLDKATGAVQRAWRTKRARAKTSK